MASANRSTWWIRSIGAFSGTRSIFRRRRQSRSGRHRRGADPGRADAGGRRERVAAGYALDLDFDKPGDFVDELLRDLPVKWLAPYLYLVGGYAKACEGKAD